MSSYTYFQSAHIFMEWFMRAKTILL